MKAAAAGRRSVSIPPKLAKRIGELFCLAGSPSTLNELGTFLRRHWSQRLSDPRLNEWFRDVSSGRAIFGEVNYQTHQKVRLKDGREAYTACALDTLIEGHFQPVGIESTCFHCNQPISVQMSRGTVTGVRPSTLVMWLGASNGTSCTCETDACPYINFFASKEHASEWRRKSLGELGMVMTLRQSLELARNGWWEPVRRILKTSPATRSTRPPSLNVIQ